MFIQNFTMEKGVSAVIVNNQKGIDTWNKVKDELEYIKILLNL